MKKLAATIATIALSSTSVLAADMAVKAPPGSAPALNWSGWYIGGNAGGAWGKSNFTTSGTNSGSFGAATFNAVLVTGNGDASSSAFTGGVQLGYNFQRNSVVFGIESDFDSLRLKSGRTSAVTVPVALPPTFTTTDSLRTDWLFTFRPRLGVVVNNALFYGTAGLAVTQVKQSHTLSISTVPGATEIGSVEDTRAGWTAGGGIEWAFASPWSAKLEYLHADFGQVGYTGVIGGLAFPQPLNHTVNVRVDLARVGLNYRFH